MGCAGHYGPELGVGRVGSTAVPGRRLRPRRCRLPGFAVHGRRPPAGTQRPPRHRVAGAFAEPDHLLPPHRGGRRSGFLSLAQRRAGGCRRRPSRSLPGIRPAADAGHRRRRGRAAAGCRRPRARRSVHRHRLRHHARRRSARPAVGDGHRARRPRIRTSCSRRHRRAVARRADPPLRSRPLARVSVRGDARHRLPRVRWSARPVSRRSTSASRTAAGRRRS